MDKVVGTLVDERDVRWETHKHHFRVVIIKDGGWWSYNVDNVDYPSVLAWAQEQTEEGASYYIAIRVRAGDGHGLLWIHPEPHAYQNPEATPYDG